MYSSYGMGELSVAPLDGNFASAVTAMQFSPHCEALWAGTETGHIFTLQAPSLQPYAHWQAHPVGSPVLEVLAAGDGVLSLSAHRLSLHGLGGAPRWSINDESGHLTAVCLDGGVGSSGGRAVLGRSGCRMSLVDLGTGKVVVEQDVAGLMGGEGVTLLRGPVNRGALCCATSLGRLALIDPRTKLRADSALIAAPGGVAALDARGDTVAAAGYGMRAGSVVAENCVKVFDLRAGLRMLYTLPTAGPPAALAFHPMLPTTLLVALPSALFCMADTATGSASNVCQADMASDSLSTAALSPSGELVALGGSGGYVHVWGELGAAGPGGQGRRVNKGAGSVAPNVPPMRPRPAVELLEEDSFGSAPQYPPTPLPGASLTAIPSLASDLEPHESSAVGLPPRVLDAGLRKDMRMVDGVGYLPNPHFSRSKALPDMVRELAPLRHGPACRLSMKVDRVDPAAARAERQRQRAAEGGVVLPLRYQYVEIRHYGRLKWEEFDFSYYNRTRFAGLENDLPNAYCNALLQVLYFIPEFRGLVMSHAPEPDSEFCLTCELSFLFAMLQRSVGLPCQATNLLRTLRSLREAAALGLLDGGGIGPAAGAAGDAGAAVTAMAALGGGGAGSSETELSRRVAALSRFMLEQMHRDATNARAPSPGPFRSGIAPQPSPANAALAPALEALMGISFRLRMTCLTGNGGESVRDARAFQVDLQYPASREKAARAAEEARQLGLNRLPGAGPAAEDPPGVVPTFAQLLQRSLLGVSATRAWVDEARGYALVRKVRVPMSLPPLLTVNVAVGDSEEAAWWLPTKGPDGTTPLGEANRLPWAIAVVSRPQTFELEVHQADRAEQLYEQLAPALSVAGVVACVYELVGAVFQIRDLDEAADPAWSGNNAAGAGGATRPGAKPHQGHLVTMIKVPQQYWDEVPEPRLTSLPTGSMADFVPGRREAVEAAAAAAGTSGDKGGKAGSGRTAGGGNSSAPGTGSSNGLAASTSAGGSGSGGGGLGGGISLPDDLDDIFAGGMSLGGSDMKDGAADGAAGGGGAGSRGSPTSSGGLQATRKQGSMGHGPRGHPQGPEWVLFNDFSVSPAIPSHEVTATYANQKLPCLVQYKQVPPPPHLKDTILATTGTPPASAAAAPPPVAPLPPPDNKKGGRHSKQQQQQLQAQQLQQQQAAAAAAAAAASPSAAAAAAPAPVLTLDQFRQLCSSAPLQGAMANLPPFRFKPLDLVRMAPRPGIRFAIDAEFVASSAPESRTVERAAPSSEAVGPLAMLGASAHHHGGSVDLVQLKQSRLTLARVAVVAAEPGPLAGSCCVDDYVRAVEPVYDYLTRWSGIQPGDLDPQVSRHYTTTLKHTYLKLKYLLDCGCVFVGHDLRKDFRCINMVVPPEQVIDTSELFRHRGGRKLSLRFLASYLLGAAIQQGGGGGHGHHPHHHHHHHHGGVGGGGGAGSSGVQVGQLGHDAIEDARTAMRLYHKYLELTANDSFVRVLDEMYTYGKQFGWDPVLTMTRNGSAPPQQPAAA